jgi:hypothetical protein
MRTRFTAVCLNLAPVPVPVSVAAHTNALSAATGTRRRRDSARNTQQASWSQTTVPWTYIYKRALGIALINRTTHCSIPRATPVLHPSTMRVFAIAATFATMLAVVAASPLEEKRCATYLPCPCSRQPGCACC